MYGLVAVVNGHTIACVGPTQRAVSAWFQDMTADVSANHIAWRMRDRTGWCAASDNGGRLEMPAKVSVVWG